MIFVVLKVFLLASVLSTADCVVNQVRTMEHLLQYGEPAIRRAVPLALALLSVSDPKLTVRTLPSPYSLLTHGVDPTQFLEY